MSVKLARASDGTAYLSMAPDNWQSDFQAFKAETRADISSMRSQLLLYEAELERKSATLAELKAWRDYVQQGEDRKAKGPDIESLLKKAARDEMMELIYWPFRVSIIVCLFRVFRTHANSGYA